MQKFSKVFLIAYPFLHGYALKRTRKANLTAQYRFVIDRLAKQKSVLVFGLGFERSDVAKEVKSLQGYAEEKLGIRFVRGNFDKLVPLLDKHRTIKISGCGELMELCSHTDLEVMERTLKTVGFKAEHVSSSLVASMSCRTSKPFFSRKQFETLKRKIGRRRLL